MRSSMGSSRMRERIPWVLRAPVRRARNAIALRRTLSRQRARWEEIAAAEPRPDAVAVSYGVERMPPSGEIVYGGHVKFSLLHEALPNSPRDFNVLYLGSSALPVEASRLVELARRRGAAFVWNQNGVAYPGWYGDGWQLVNEPRARLLHEADHVFFQSAFCKLSADRFYGERQGSWEVLHNPVDTSRFVPAARPSRPLTLLLGGNQYQRYRLETALDTVALVRRERPDARLLVAGALSFADDARPQAEAVVRRLGLDGAVELLGPYTQAEAPALMQRTDLLLHTKYNDPCPTVVLEAMAAGLPVVYSASGGTPELVGNDAGIGIAAPLDWERDHPPVAEELAEAVLRVADGASDYSAAARERALRFDVKSWIERHHTVFTELIRLKPPVS
jgi:glycosyltransferase involved in cell wall biosynthesis